MIVVTRYQPIIKAIEVVRQKLNDPAELERMNALDNGICYHVEQALELDFDAINLWDAMSELAALDWPESSGSQWYPIPSSNPDMDASNYFIYFNEKYKGEQLAYRISYTDFLIKWFKRHDR